MNKSIEKVASLDSVVAASPDQVSCDLGGEAVILNVKNGIYYGLNDVGAVVWSLVADPQPVSKILDALLDRFEIDRERCQSDLMALLSELGEHGLIQIKYASLG